MIKNYVKVAWRNLLRHKLFAGLNIGGLGLGMACCLLILLFIRHELSFDRHFPDVERLYRVTYHATNDNDYARIPPPIALRMPEFFSEVETTARAFTGSMSVRVPALPGETSDRDFEETSLYFVDSTFVDLFPLEFVRGDASTRLAEPFTTLINEEVALRYFGDRDPIGATITIEGTYIFTVVGVVEDFPDDSHLHFNLLLPYDNMFDVLGEEAGTAMRNNLENNWLISHSHTYAKLAPGALPESVNERFDAFVTQYAPEQLQLGQQFSLTPVTDIHLNTPTVFLQPEPQGDLRTVYLFGAIAVLTLLLPCFNFINLSTAQAMGRTQEIGIRQALGAQRNQLFTQFLGESFLICLLAFVLALGLTLIGLPYMSELTQRTLTPALLLDPLVIVGFLGVLVLTGFLGGGYPALLIARTRIVAALRRTVAAAPQRGISLRKVLVATQFAISILLIGGTVLIFQQLDYLLNRPLGFESDGVIAAPLFSQNMNTFVFSGVDGELRTRLNTFEETILQHPAVLGSTLSRNVPGIGAIGRMTVPEGQPADEPIPIMSMSVDYDFVEFYGLGLVTGRSFEQERGSDHLDAFLVNETAVREFGWGTPEEALGKTINLEGKEGLVVGVLQDYNFISLQNPIRAMLMEVNVGAFQSISIRIAGDDVQETLDYLGEQWQQFFPEQAFDPFFLDDQLEDLYATQQRLGRLLRIFAILGVIVSCLGAYGLVVYNTQRRLREIGVRKVLGASLWHILVLLYRELTLLFMAGLVLAAPVLYLAGRWWLSDFTYRIDPGPGALLLSGGLMLLLAWLTIGYQSIRAARVNPVACLRVE